MRLYIRKENDMRTDERNLRQQFGRNPGFKVPEGYFEHLVPEVMNRLPESDSKVIPMSHTRSRLVRWRTGALAAACVCGAVFGLSVILHKQHMSAPQSMASASTTQEVSLSKTIDQLADYSMIDNEDMYAYVSGNE